MKKRSAQTERLRIPHLSVIPQDLAPYVTTGCWTSSGLIPPSLLIRYEFVEKYYIAGGVICQ